MNSLKEYIQQHYSEYEKYPGKIILLYVQKGKLFKKICRDEKEARSSLPASSLLEQITEYVILPIPKISLKPKPRRKIR